MNIVLFEPQIPQNTGNIIRTCSLTGTNLFLVKPLGFSLSEKKLRRAGLDYIDEVDVTLLDDLIPFLENGTSRFVFFSSHATRTYSEWDYETDDFLIFGSETSGLPQAYWDLWPENFYTIPMRPSKRCLNLANAVSIVLYEGLRQQGFALNL